MPSSGRPFGAPVAAATISGLPHGPLQRCKQEAGRAGRASGPQPPTLDCGASL